jgi:hypothetical protein
MALGGTLSAIRSDLQHTRTLLRTRQPPGAAIDSPDLLAGSML